MPVPNPVMPVKGAGTTLWVYKGSGDPYANPLSDVDWSRLAKVKDLTPGELTAESYDDSYLDDKDADWTATGQGQKSAGDTSFTLAWMPREQGQQALLAWFNEGDTRAYKIRFPNGTVDVFRGWVSSIGKAVTAKEVITRTVKVTNVGRPSMAEDRSTVTAATGMTVTPASTSVVKGQSTTLTVAFQPEGATDKSFRAVSADKTKATVSVILFSLGASMVLGGVAQMLAPKARTPRTQTTDNGKQNTYFSSLDNMVAQGNVLPVLYGEMRVGSRVVSQEISTADEGDGGQVVVIGR
ncbi:phage tail protein [Escherichia coli]|nr:phage tail protein [Escherichia coli]